ncbi:coiled-coil domain-containing protein 43 [Erpetoichthys calabaricus]|uniref:coiled-coil domain-containing protein 43 n=1 Tax=Erpetoichthys calabaricus TaxID=27687 RepID=UPI002234E2B1|nr:coiled-coil domain-containing protein 43 [Erpetoichthys calabaricus]
MAAPGDFDGWLVRRLDSLDVDGDVYAAYILGVLREEEEEDDDDDDGDTASALRDILSPFLEEDALEDVCKEIINQWALSSAHGTAKSDEKDAEVQAIASLIEKQAQIVVKQKEASEEEKLRKAALLAQYANVTDDEEYPLRLPELVVGVGLRTRLWWSVPAPDRVPSLGVVPLIGASPVLPAVGRALVMSHFRRRSSPGHDGSAGGLLGGGTALTGPEGWERIVLICSGDGSPSSGNPGPDLMCSPHSSVTSAIVFFNPGTEEEDPEESGAAAAPAAYDGSKSLFKNTNMEDVLNAKKLEREKARGESQKKKEQDKMQRDKDKVARQERKDKEKKRTQKGERRR